MICHGAGQQHESARWKSDRGHSAPAYFQSIAFCPAIRPESAEDAGCGSCQQYQTREQARVSCRKSSCFAQISGQPREIEIKSVAKRKIREADEQKVPVQQVTPFEPVTIRHLSAFFLNELQLRRIHR